MPRPRRLSPIFFTVFGLLFLGVAVAGDSWVEMRQTYQQAEKALSAGQTKTYRKLKEELKDYPLLPYLEYAELRRNLGAASKDKIVAFLENYSDTPLSDRLRYTWLMRLARIGDHKTLIENFRGTNNTELECHYRNALLATGEKEKALAAIENLWVVGESQPSACDPLFSAWRKQGGITDDVVWKRIRLAMARGNLQLTNYLKTLLPVKDGKTVEIWQSVHRNPRSITSRKDLKADNEIHRLIAMHGAVRLAYRDVVDGLKAWDELNKTFSFTSAERAQAQRTISILLAQDRRPEALTYLTSIDPEHENQRIREWRIRMAIYEQDWSSVLTSIDWLTPEERQDTRWQYWQARAQEALGFQESAEGSFRELAQVRNYHSFLAADRGELPYSFENKPLVFTLEELDTVENLPGILRARELYFLDKTADARREWEFARTRMDNKTMIAAAKLAERWGWYSRAIMGAAESGYWDDVPMRFPLGYREAVLVEAQTFNVEPEWVYGILRQESAFITDARSSRGALGLMQLLPGTGRYIARRYNTRLSHPYELLQAEKNIRLGSAYLRDVRDRLYDHPVLATAAYNAGPNRVKRWLPKNEEMPADIWVETVPYDETRDYVERVMAYTLIYDWRLDNMTRRLRDFMRPVEPSQNPKEKIGEPRAP